MATKKNEKSEMAKSIFLALVERWDVKDRAGAAHLARTSFEIAEGYLEVEKGSAPALTKPVRD